MNYLGIAIKATIILFNGVHIDDLIDCLALWVVGGSKWDQVHKFLYMSVYLLIECQFVVLLNIAIEKVIRNR